MQKNSKLIGVVLLAAAMGLMFWQSKDQSARMKTWQASQASQAALVDTEKTASEATAQKVELSQPVLVQSPSASGAPVLAKPVAELPAERLYTLENAFLRLDFTDRGGAVRSVAFKEYPAVKGAQAPYTMIAPERAPFFALNLNSEAQGYDLEAYALVAQTPTSLAFERSLTKGLALRREYTLTVPEKKHTASGYVLEQKLSWTNTSGADLQLPSYTLNLGAVPRDPSDPDDVFLNFGAYDGREAKFIGLSYFNGGGILFWQKPPSERYEVAKPLQWAALKSKFFALVTTPAEMAKGASSSVLDIGSGKTVRAITGELRFDSLIVRSGASASASLSTYAGPKEYARLASLGGHQDEVMQWGWPIFSFFSKLFISMLNGIAGFVHNYGVAIVFLTLLIRAAMWPFTAAAANASKKMAVVQPLLKQAQEKYKSNPERLQKETLKIFQEHQVNPMAGCLPALLQIPVFLGFFYMLRSAAELRFESFLWIKDLSMPDTVAHIAGFPLNPLPIVMLVTMYYQMKLTPSSADPEQRKVMQFTPLLFSFLLYNFSAGLTLYWTLSNLVSIIQQLLVNRTPTSSGGIGSDQNAPIEAQTTVLK